jgi:hypothetical protein
VSVAISIRDEGPLAGLGDLVPAADQLTDTEIARAAEAIEAADLPLATTLGVPEAWGNFVQQFSRRRLLRQLPDEERGVTWFESHSPPGGAALVRFSRSVSQSSTLQLGVFGSGLGTGRAVTLTLNGESDPRPECARYLANLRIRPRVYEIGKRESIEIELVELLGTTVELFSPCPWCGRPSAEIDPFEFDAKPYIDLRGDTVGATISEAIEVATASTFDAGFAIPTLPVSLKLMTSVKGGVTITAESHLAAGRRYQGFRRSSAEAAPHSPMWAVDVGPG